MSGRPPTLRIVSWNVNGLRAIVGRGPFLEWLKTAKADVVGVQEVRASAEQVMELPIPSRWRTSVSAAQRPGYSGVALLSKKTPDGIETDLGVKEFDVEGRVQIASFGALRVANVYFPNGNGKDRDNGRVPYKLKFYRTLFEKLEGLRESGHPVIVMGDFNTAVEEIDLARPKDNRKTSGFLPEERDELRRWLDRGWIDTFRHQHPDEEGHYTWWSQRFGVRERNVGWRIDYVLCTPSVLPHLRRAFSEPQRNGSDHCPVGVDLDPGVMS